MMNVSVGVPFDIELGSAPGTGYLWQAQSLPEGLKLLGSDYSQADNAAVGDAGKQVFHLQAERAGGFDAHFELKRRWEAQSVEQCVVEIEAR